jgi:hypothetical protein
MRSLSARRPSLLDQLNARLPLTPAAVHSAVQPVVEGGGHAPEDRAPIVGASEWSRAAATGSPSRSFTYAAMAL